MLSVSFFLIVVLNFFIIGCCATPRPDTPFKHDFQTEQKEIILFVLNDFFCEERGNESVYFIGQTSYKDSTRDISNDLFARLEVSLKKKNILLRQLSTQQKILVDSAWHDIASIDLITGKRGSVMIVGPIHWYNFNTVEVDINTYFGPLSASGFSYLLARRYSLFKGYYWVVQAIIPKSIS